MVGMSDTRIPNRLIQVPSLLCKFMEDVIANREGYRQTAQEMRIKRVLRIAYREGYHDGYRDGHTDAENGHDERVTVNLA